MFPRRYTLAVLLSTSSRQKRRDYVPFPSCGGCSIAATPPRRSSSRFRKSYNETAVLGGVSLTGRSVFKKQIKESKGKFRFQKVKFKPYGFLKKSPPLHFQYKKFFDKKSPISIQQLGSIFSKKLDSF